MSDHQGVPEQFHPYLDRIDETWSAWREAVEDRARRRVSLVDDEVEALYKAFQDAQSSLVRFGRGEG